MTSMREFLAKAPRWYRDLLGQVELYVVKHWSTDYNNEFPEHDERSQVGMLVGAEAMSSKVRGSSNSHIIAIDIDLRAMLVPSSTPGHHHLVMEHQVSWENLERLLDAMAACGLVQEGYVKASKERKATFLRLPWIRKGTEHDDAVRAQDEWLAGPPPPDPDAPWEKLGMEPNDWLKYGVA